MSEQNQESKCCEVCGYTQTLPLTHHHDCAWVLKPKLAAAVEDTRRLDWLEQDGNLKHLWNTSVPAKSLRDCTWDVREAIDGAMQLHGAPPAAGWDPAAGGAK